MNNKKIITRQLNEKQKVKLEIDRHGMDLYVMRNGYQWLGVPVDDELLKQIESVIHEYFGE